MLLVTIIVPLRVLFVMIVIELVTLPLIPLRMLLVMIVIPLRVLLVVIVVELVTLLLIPLRMLLVMIVIPLGMLLVMVGVELIALPLIPLRIFLVIYVMIGIKLTGTFRDVSGPLRGVRCGKNDDGCEHAEDKRELHV
ncbi:hypothetical protein BDR07DRAFT_1412673 [Suillus spraguei]|nr:hypothetical protein BDR07DRAFT_1412673 [Suillus spraguei]